MTNDYSNHPLNGLNLDEMLGQLVRQYGWEVLAEQININCFKTNPSFESSLKYLRNTDWAREKLEAFYLYRFKQLPRPNDIEHQKAPRSRLIDSSLKAGLPANIELGDKPFFDDPASGPIFPSRQAVQDSQRRSRLRSSKGRMAADAPSSGVPQTAAQPADPWANWKNKNKNKNK